MTLKAIFFLAVTLLVTVMLLSTVRCLQTYWTLYVLIGCSRPSSTVLQPQLWSGVSRIRCLQSVSRRRRELCLRYSKCLIAFFAFALFIWGIVAANLGVEMSINTVMERTARSTMSTARCTMSVASVFWLREFCQLTNSCRRSPRLFVVHSPSTALKTG